MLSVKNFSFVNRYSETRWPQGTQTNSLARYLQTSKQLPAKNTIPTSGINFAKMGKGFSISDQWFYWTGSGSQIFGHRYGTWGIFSARILNQMCWGSSVGQHPSEKRCKESQSVLSDTNKTGRNTCFLLRQHLIGLLLHEEFKLKEFIPEHKDTFLIWGLEGFF